MNKHSREPVKHTCPDIDKMIKTLEAVYKLCRLSGREEKDELINIIDDIDRELWDTESQLENLRKANDSLRSWGIEEAERVDELEEQIEQLQLQLQQT